MGLEMKDPPHPGSRVKTTQRLADGGQPSCRLVKDLSCHMGGGKKGEKKSVGTWDTEEEAGCEGSR